MVSEIEQQVKAIKESIEYIGHDYRKMRLKHLWMLETAMNALDAIQQDFIFEADEEKEE